MNRKIFYYILKFNFKSLKLMKKKSLKVFISNSPQVASQMFYPMSHDFIYVMAS